MTPSAFSFGRAAPTICVTDIDRARAFYEGVLGFRSTFENGQPVGFVILKRDAAELHLTRNAGHRASTQNVAHVLVDDARALYRHLEGEGVRVVKAIRDADYGVRGFVVADPDGNRIDFGQTL